MSTCSTTRRRRGLARWLVAALAMLALVGSVSAPISPAPQAAAQTGPIAWELPPTAYRVDIPDWYEQSRVHVHSRWNIHRCFAKLCSLEANPEGFWGFAAEVERWGPTVLTRFMKGQDEGAWWQSAVGGIHPTVEVEGDIPQRLIADAAARGINSVAYYRHPEDQWAADNHPDWYARNRDGTNVNNANYGEWLSFSSPYGDFVNTRLRELIEKGAKGIYFDYRHVPDDGDYHPEAIARFTELYGGSPYSASAAQLFWWRQQLISDFFSSAQDTIRAVDPEAMIIASANSVALDVLRDSADVPKYEQGFEAAMGGQRAASTLLLDSTTGWPHIWTLPETEDTDKVMAEYVAYGTIYNRDVREPEAPSVPESMRASYGRAFELSGLVSEPMVNSQPYRHARILLNGAHQVSKSNAVASSIASAFTALDGLNVPVGFATWSQLRDGGVDPNSQVLIDPVNSRSFYSGGSGIREAVYTAITEFEAAGGTVLFAGDLTAGWSGRLASGDLAVSLQGGSSAVGFVPYVSNDGERLIVNVAAQNRSGMKIHLSDSYFAEPVSAIDSIGASSPTITAVDGGWTVDVPAASLMAQVVIDFTAPNPTAVGDVDCSETVDAADVRAILQYLVGERSAVDACPLTDPDTELHLTIGDKNGDQTTDLVDAWLLARD